MFDSSYVLWDHTARQEMFACLSFLSLRKYQKERELWRKGDRHFRDPSQGLFYSLLGGTLAFVSLNREASASLRYCEFK